MNNYPDDSYGSNAIDRARGKVIGPAIGLIVTAILSLIFVALNLASIPTIPAQFQAQRDQINKDPNATDAEKKKALEIYDQVEPVAATGTVAFSALFALSSIIVLVGGFKLKNLSSAGWSRTAAILAMLPFCTCVGCVVGLPVGIWAFIVMGNPDVKAAFARNRQPAGGDNFDSYPPPV